MPDIPVPLEQLGDDASVHLRGIPDRCRTQTCPPLQYEGDVPAVGAVLQVADIAAERSDLTRTGSLGVHLPEPAAAQKTNFEADTPSVSCTG